MAPSMNTPVGCPAGSRRIWPPAGAAVVLVDPGPAHGLRVGPARVAVHPLEPDRPVRRDRVEHGRGREGPARPEALVPVPSGDPGVAGSAVAILAFTRRATSSSELTPRRSTCSRLAPSDSTWPWASIRPGIGEVGGAVDDAWFAAPGYRSRSSPAAHRDDDAASRGDRLGPGIRGVAGPDPSGVQDEVGRPVRLRSQGSARQFRPRGALHRGLALGDHGHAVDEEVPDAGRIPRRVVECRGIAKRRGVEDDDVGERARRSLPRSGRPRISAGRPVQDRMACSRLRLMLVEGVADLARKRPVGPGVRPVAAAGHVGRAVGGRGDEVVPHDQRARPARSSRS